MHRIDGEGATTSGRFTEGNPTTGVPATVVTADWLNSVQEEIAAVLTAAGLTLNKGNNAQLLQAIKSLIAGGGVSVTAAGVSVVDAGDYFTGIEVEAALQQLAQKIYSGTLNASQVLRPVLSVTGASQQTETGHAEGLLQVSHTSAATYTVRPDSALNLRVGTAIQVAQAGAGKVSFAAGSGVTILKASAFNAATLGQHAIAVLVKTAANTWRLGGALESA
ncbi:hypothetical protein [Stenotrophomonas sp. PS02298]|uniref:hypothetical protein n=1 Tax=Stenotrophomonas sp. PS02298 TaxID=2991424 RepID=UPI002499BECC|nr:hypothetical protein [Stenotrophomonas sp. PS02298]